MLAELPMARLPSPQVILILSVCFLVHLAHGVYKPPLSTSTVLSSLSRQSHRNVAGSNGDLISRCEERFTDAVLDHFTWNKREDGGDTFRQRYFICREYWNKYAKTSNHPRPIFFYVGNEADVTLYLNHTGLMWENAESFGALLVFAEHRYYGKSKPFAPDTRKHMGYLTAEQAMADYAVLIRHLKNEFHAEDSPVIGFGGSYGGMLAAWFRMKYPHLMAGAIAASAPIWEFFGQEPPFNEMAFAQGVTYDASPEGGSSENCVPNARKTWSTLVKMGETEEGRALATAALGLCSNSAMKSTNDAIFVRDWLASAWDYMAMGDFPYPSSYMLNGGGTLPAYPVREACDALKEGGLEGEELLTAMAKAVGVFYNYSGSLECYDTGGGPNPETDEDANFWDYQWCTEMFMPQARDGVNDMFWLEPFDVPAAVRGCKDNWGVTPRKKWAVTEWGGADIGAASNIVFSNGLLDPWHGGGVMVNVSESVVAVIIKEGAHHLDLMFSNPEDPDCVKRAREVELEHIRKWVHGHRPTPTGVPQQGVQVQPTVRRRMLGYW